MGVIYEAELSPTKPELLARWVPTRPWGASVPDGTALERVGAYRFDDPAGQVGVETHLLRAGDRVLQVPLTYRASKLFGADEHLITTVEHSVLGTRWVYDGCHDPVYVATLATAILTGGEQADVVRERADGRREPVEPDVRVGGSGASDASVVPRIGRVSATDDETATTITAGGMTVVLLREVDARRAGSWPSLTGIWAGRDERAVLALVPEPDEPAAD